MMSMPVILGLVGGLLMLVSLFLPWANITLLGIPVGINGLYTVFGILMLIFGIIGMVMLFMKKSGMALVAGIMGILAILFWLLAYLGISALVSVSQMGCALTPTACSGFSVGTGIGLFVAPLGAILLTVGGFMQRGALKKQGK